LSELNGQVVQGNKIPKSKYFQASVTPKQKRVDLEFIGKPIQLLNHDEVVEWFEGEREFWQENY